jgi:acetyl-CoA/propionyl-CoA carboxylase, biotin carboxylase, biotin carboxyl carrier protein
MRIPLHRSAPGVAEWLLVEEGDRRWRVAIAADASATWVFVDGQVARIEREDATPTRGRTRRRSEAGVMSPMPATVVAINAVQGQSVNEGDTLIVLEAMKMELPIKAPRSGVVKAIHCAKGELVQPGVNLLELE